jgi:glucose/arabinose dehydrogenase
MLYLLLFTSIILVITLPSVSISNYALGAEETELPTIHDKNIGIQVVYKGLKFPTKMAFLGPNDILVLEKNEGTIQRIVNGVMLSKPLLDINVSNSSERGMLGVAIGNNGTNDKSRNVFLYFTSPEDQGTLRDARNLASNYLYRFDLVNNRLVNPKVLVHLPSFRYSQHNGGDLLIGPDDNVYVIIGNVGGSYDEYHTKAKTQNYKGRIDPDGRGGILAMTQDGEFAYTGGILGGSFPLNLYYAYGIRNSFGIAFDPVSGKLWDTENGGTNYDEINLIEPGFNSGSEQLEGLSTLHKDFSKSKLETFHGKGHYSDPEFTWNDTVGLTGIKFLNSEKLGKQYENDLFAGDFHNGNLYHFDLNKKRTALSLTGPLKDKIANKDDELRNALFGQGFGGITDIKVGPDGYLYILSLYQGGDNCEITNKKLSDCVRYESDVLGTIFRIVPKIK